MSGGSANERSSDSTITGINVTPLVDITLVLLIVFLVTAKVIVSQSIPLDVPPASKTTSATQTTLAITIDRAGAIFVDGRPTASDDEVVRIASEVRVRDKDVRAVIRADAAARHGAVVRAIDDLRYAQVTRIAFAVEKKPPR